MNISEMTKSKIRDLIEGFREFDVCGPSDDPDAQTAMVVAHNSMIIVSVKVNPPTNSNDPVR